MAKKKQLRKKTSKKKVAKKKVIKKKKSIKSKKVELEIDIAVNLKEAEKVDILEQIKICPITFNSECFISPTIHPAGFQAADLKAEYFNDYQKLLAEYGQRLKIVPGNPGPEISISLMK